MRGLSGGLSSQVKYRSTARTKMCRTTFTLLTGIIVASTPAPHPHLVYNASLLAKTWSLLQTEDTAGSLRGALARVDTEARNHLQASVNSVPPDDVIAFQCERRLSFHTLHTKKLLGGAGGGSHQKKGGEVTHQRLSVQEPAALSFC